MRLARWAVLAAALAGSACPPAASRGGDGGTLAAHGSADGGFELKPAQLDAWLTYQRRWLKALAPAGDAGVDAGTDARELRRRAQLDEVLRADAGLSEDDVDQIEAVVAAVATRRAIAALAGAELTQELEKSAAGLTGDKRQQADKALAELKARAGVVGDLSAERARFGSPSVEVVLSREAEVRVVWDAMLEARAPAGAPVAK